MENSDLWRNDILNHFLDIQRTLHHDIFLNKNQQDAIFLKFILVKQTVNITSMTNTSCGEYSIKTPDDGQ